MSDKSKTPRTDSEMLDAKFCGKDIVFLEFARQLELELAEANEKIKLLQFLVKADTIAIEKLRDEVGVDKIREIYLAVKSKQQTTHE